MVIATQIGLLAWHHASPSMADDYRSAQWTTRGTEVGDVTSAEYVADNAPIPAFSISTSGKPANVQSDPSVIPAAGHGQLFPPPKGGEGAAGSIRRKTDPQLEQAVVRPVDMAAGGAQSGRRTEGKGVAIPIAKPAPEKSSTRSSAGVEAPAPMNVVQPATVPVRHTSAKKSPLRDVERVSHWETEIDTEGPWPTVIYKTSSLTLFAPATVTDESGQSVAVVAVVLKKTAGIDSGATPQGLVQDGKATFPVVSSGAYDVLYQTSGSSTISAGRRIIVELKSPALIEIPGMDDPFTAAGNSAEPSDLSSANAPPDLHGQQGTSGQIRHARDLVERGATYSALREFQDTIARSISPDATAIAGELPSLDAFLENPSTCTQDLVAGRCSAEQLAHSFAGQVDHRKDLAPAFLGLGLAFQSVGAEERPLVIRADSAADLCFLTAHELDPKIAGPLRELAARKMLQGRAHDAEHYLQQAISEAPDADTYFLMGQLYSKNGDVRAATACYLESTRRDPWFLPAAYELARIDLTKPSRAMYGADLRQLATRLISFGTCEFLTPEERSWAVGELHRIDWLLQEVSANASGLTARGNVHSSAPHVASTVHPSMSREGTEDADLPPALGARRSSSDADAARPGSSVAGDRVIYEGNARPIPSDATWAGAERSSITPTSGTADSAVNGLATSAAITDESVERQRESATIPRAAAKQGLSMTDGSRRIPVARTETQVMGAIDPSKVTR